MNYSKYYHLENYLFKEVKENFQKRGYLKPEEFFCIVIWKANRAKGRIKGKLLKRRGGLEQSIKKLTSEIFKVPKNRERLKILLDGWKFNLPMATAILTVLYPKDFTIYDIRVRKELGIDDFAGRKNQIERYFSEFLPRVKEKAKGESLRDKDCYLWGKSFYEDLATFLDLD